ncbi:hypothetical protein MXL91_20350 [Achromobacter ruhlandii]|uniref:hypothetical protein n=1 Tax=Achromobacter ruhlandii TaxID=72557 RepID=UPI002DB65685|nr:hypothetical protein [Achromobacter ruhlandii]MEB6663818.1 hypothetical protein [Achromobacter ruhlandii]
MSRRYGRNQRRHARERIAELEQQGADLHRARALDQGLLASMTERNSGLAEILDLVRKELPSHPFLPVDERPRDFSGMTQAVQRGEPVRAFISKPVPAFLSQESALVMDTERLHAEVVVLLADTDLSAMRDKVHMRVRLGREVTAYAISTSALQTMDPAQLQELLQHEIAGALARSLVEAWQGFGLRLRRP